MLRAYFTTTKIEIFREGLESPIVTQHAEPNKRPFIHPILAPDGVGSLTENEPSHHPWQHGLYVGLNDVNGFGFWTEGLTGKALDGTFHPHPLEPPVKSGGVVDWSVVTDWRGPDGSLLLTETQAWCYEANELTVEWTLQAAIGIRFGQSSYGGLFLRMPWRSPFGGDLLTSEGATTPESAEGQRAKWIAISMPLRERDGGQAGLAFLDYPTNPEHPSPWRVDGELGICPSRSIAGEWSLVSGERAVSTYRLIPFIGVIDSDFVNAAWDKFANEK